LADRQIDQCGALSRTKMQPLLATLGPYAVPRLSPDGRKLVFLGEGSDIYVYDMDRDTATRLTFTHHAGPPVWAPDGKHILFQQVSDEFTFSWIRSDGAGEP